MACKLKLISLLYDDISFKRLGNQNDEDINFSTKIKIGSHKDYSDIKKITITLTGYKREEYKLTISISAIFQYDGPDEDDLLHVNAVSMLLPYIRSQLTILTSQPGVDPVILPPFNVYDLLNKPETNK